MNAYEVLGIGASASDAEVKAAYRKLVLSCHPDKTQDHEDGTDAFMKAKKAYELLKDPALRSEYDARISATTGRRAVTSVSLKDLTLEHDTTTGDSYYVYDCRCGEPFVLFPEDVVSLPHMHTCEKCCVRVEVVSALPPDQCAAGSA
eukprot:GDKH01008201.1.p1 GENE.GDKH01008201.1~~GDKH01008201.1.p1  ORF type:complete len:147 (-),score=10.08 GDKH01008201.1:64-504(-)